MKTTNNVYTYSFPTLGHHKKHLALYVPDILRRAFLSAKITKERPISQLIRDPWDGTTYAIQEKDSPNH